MSALEVEDSELQRIILESLADSRHIDEDAALALRLQQEDDRIASAHAASSYRPPQRHYTTTHSSTIPQYTLGGIRGNAGSTISIPVIDSSDEDEDELRKAMYMSMKTPYVPAPAPQTTSTSSFTLSHAPSTSTVSSTAPPSSALRTSSSGRSISTPQTQTQAVPTTVVAPQRVSAVSFSDFVSSLPSSGSSLPASTTTTTTASSSASLQSPRSSSTPQGPQVSSLASATISADIAKSLGELYITPEREHRANERNNKVHRSSHQNSSKPRREREAGGNVGIPGNVENNFNNTNINNNNTNNNNNNSNSNYPVSPPISSEEKKPAAYGGERKILKPKKASDRKGGRIVNPFPTATAPAPTMTLTPTPNYSPIRSSPPNPASNPIADPATTQTSATQENAASNLTPPTIATPLLATPQAPNYSRYCRTTYHTSTTNNSINIADDLRAYPATPSTSSPSPATPTFSSLPPSPATPLPHSQAYPNVYSNTGYPVNTPPTALQTPPPPSNVPPTAASQLPAPSTTTTTTTIPSYVPQAASSSHSLFNIPSYFQPNPVHSLAQPPMAISQQPAAATTRAPSTGNSGGTFRTQSTPSNPSGSRVYFHPQYRTPQQVLPVHQPSTGNAGSARSPAIPPPRSSPRVHFPATSNFGGVGYRLGNGSVDDDEAFAQQLQLQEALQAQQEYDLLNTTNGTRSMYSDDDSLAQQYQYQELMAIRRQQGVRFYDDEGSDYSDEDDDPTDENDVDHMSYEQLLALEERMGHVSRGASKADIDACPKFTVTSENGDNNTCLVCQDDMAVGNVVRRLPCMHVYHQVCIDQWLAQKATCPVCQHAIKE